MLIRQSLDIPRHSMNGVREPLLAGTVPVSSGEQEGLQCHTGGPGEEENSETCCIGGAALHPGAASDSKYEVIAECGTAPPEE